MIVRYIVSLEDQKSVMIKEYLSDKLPSALLTFINKQETRFLAKLDSKCLFVGIQARFGCLLMINK